MDYLSIQLISRKDLKQTQQKLGKIRFFRKYAKSSRSTISAANLPAGDGGQMMSPFSGKSFVKQKETILTKPKTVSFRKKSLCSETEDIEPKRAVMII